MRYRVARRSLEKQALSRRITPSARFARQDEIQRHEPSSWLFLHPRQVDRPLLEQPQAGATRPELHMHDLSTRRALVA
jgi:hypothetical protein